MPPKHKQSLDDSVSDFSDAEIAYSSDDSDNDEDMPSRNLLDKVKSQEK